MTHADDSNLPMKGQVSFGSDLEQQIADALVSKGVFIGYLSSDELEPIFGAILLGLVSRQLLHGREIFVESEVIDIQIDIADGQMRVHSAARLLHPIAAELEFDYVLENAPLSDPPNLRLKRDYVQIVERTARFDLFARVALSAVGVQQIAQRELRNPAQIIKKTLPPRLKLNGCTTPLEEVTLQIEEDDTLHFYIAGQED